MMLRMLSIKHCSSKSRSGARVLVTAIAIAFVVAACASAPATVEMEPKSIANQLGLPECRVSVPLSQSEVIEDAKRIGNPNPEKYPEWIEMTSSIRPGDQLRLVNCLRASQYNNVGDPYYYALIRDGKIISKFHIGFFN